MTMDYELLEEIQPDQAYFRCISTYQGKPIEWTVRLLTLRRYSKENLPGIERSRQMMETRLTSQGCGEITVALDLDVINHTAIIKTIMMIRQWKNLGPGHHEWGELVSFED